MLTELLTYFVNMPCLTLFLCTGYCIVVHSPVGVFIISFLCFLFLLVCLLFLSVRRFKLPQQQQHFYRLKSERERESGARYVWERETELKTLDRGGFIMFDGCFCVPFVYLLCRRCLSSVMHNANVLAASAALHSASAFHSTLKS